MAYKIKTEINNSTAFVWIINQFTYNLYSSLGYLHTNFNFVLLSVTSQPPKKNKIILIFIYFLHQANIAQN
jgi:hypothetical protein